MSHRPQKKKLYGSRRRAPRIISNGECERGSDLSDSKWDPVGEVAGLVNPVIILRVLSVNRQVPVTQSSDYQLLKEDHIKGTWYDK